ncbi:MAG TPA: nucleoside hydrolase [Verrucomicrobiae bacterium]|nr:nucleoside hydrolase [Verrucomicrobiae bacterium]
MIEDKKIAPQTRREFLTTSAGIAVATTVAAIPVRAAGSAASSLAAFPPSASKPRRIIIDTDPGVDDAMAIFLALRSPELKIEAITPVSGNVPLALTLPNALRLVEIAGRTDVPVAGGASVPLVRDLVTAKYVHGENGLGGVEFPEPTVKPVAETATEIICRLVRSNPGEITIVAVGPLTNIATVLRSDPEIARLIPAIVLMGGGISHGNVTPAAEFNLYVDPEAARVVFDAGIPLTMVGLDVTEKVIVNESHIRQLRAAPNPVSQAAAKILQATFDLASHSDDVTYVAMHDPLTVASLIDPSLLSFTDYYVEIETEGEFTAGMSVGWLRPPARGSAPMALAGPAASVPETPFHTNAKVATGVHPERFFDLFIPRLTQA